MKNISILGSTGSIGCQTLDVIRNFPEEFGIIGLAAGKNIQLLKQQVLEFKPKIVSVEAEKDAYKIQVFIRENNLKIKVFSGQDGLNQIAENAENDFLVVATVSTASLEPVTLAIRKKITIGLASKEILVIAGEFIMKEATKYNTKIIPIDSEHAAIKQCLSTVNENVDLINRLFITASGGPFWQKSRKEFKEITKADALKHPNWAMGQKITIDSATLMNKGLEVIEAHFLFNIPYEKIQVVIHPESIIHSMAEFIDGTVLAQMSMPDMRLPIQYALMYPKKVSNNWPKADFFKLNNLTFVKPDLEKFPLLKLAYEAGVKKGVYPIVLNTANEIAVKLFLEEKLKFLGIQEFVIKSCELFKEEKLSSIADIMEFEKSTRSYLNNYAKTFS